MRVRTESHKKAEDRLLAVGAEEYLKGMQAITRFQTAVFEACSRPLGRFLDGLRQLGRSSPVPFPLGQLDKSKIKAWWPGATLQERREWEGAFDVVGAYLPVSQRGSVYACLVWDCEAGAQDLKAIISFEISNAKRRATFLSKLQRVSPNRIDCDGSEVLIEEKLLPQQTPQLEARLDKITSEWIEVLKRAKAR